LDLIASLDIFEAISGNSLEVNCSILYHYYLKIEDDEIDEIILTSNILYCYTFVTLLKEHINKNKRIL
jgi:hypothetical protein